MQHEREAPSSRGYAVTGCKAKTTVAYASAQRPVSGQLRVQASIAVHLAVRQQLSLWDDGTGTQSMQACAGGAG